MSSDDGAIDRVDHGITIPRMYFSSSSGRFDPSKIVLPVSTDMEIGIGSKPSGGLWLSPMYGETERTAWERFFVEAMMSTPELTFTRQEVSLSPDARIAVIDCMDDLKRFRMKYPYDASGIFGKDITLPSNLLDTLSGMIPIDWSDLSLDYDAVYVTWKGVRETRHGSEGHPSLMTWDVESMVVTNGEIVQSVSDPVDIVLRRD